MSSKYKLRIILTVTLVYSLSAKSDHDTTPKNSDSQLSLEDFLGTFHPEPSAECKNVLPKVVIESNTGSEIRDNTKIKAKGLREIPNGPAAGDVEFYYLNQPPRKSSKVRKSSDYGYAYHTSDRFQATFNGKKLTSSFRNHTSGIQYLVPTFENTEQYFELTLNSDGSLNYLAKLPKDYIDPGIKRCRLVRD